jgi:2-oxoacid:acceptor oxidoreductase delta subunit (pyruvate/2-ketoisovalerate family)
MAKGCEKKAGSFPDRKTLSSKRRGRRGSRAEFGLEKEEVIRESQRCLGLTGCESCEVCSLFCPDLCITRDEKTGKVLIDLDYCKGCGICAAVCPKGAIQMVLEESSS